MDNAWIDLIETQQQYIDKLITGFATINKVFEQYKHLDKLLCDKTWIDGDNPSPIRSCTYDLWQAIRTTITP